MHATTEQLARALQVITKDGQIRAFLREYDPKALDQCRTALAEAGVDPDPRPHPDQFELFDHARSYLACDECEHGPAGQVSALHGRACSLHPDNVVDPFK